MNSTLRIGSLFSGYGGLDMALQDITDTALAWVCDNDPTSKKILRHHHPDVPNLNDITKIDWNIVDEVDVITAGFPCQDISSAGNRAGIEGTRSGLWKHVVQCASVLRPRFIILENVSAITFRGLDVVAGDLAEIGYDAKWCVATASGVGAPHIRRRWFAVAEPSSSHSSGIRFRKEKKNWFRNETSFYSDSRTEWGKFAPAIARWEQKMERPAPEPIDGRGKFCPVFVEWMMGIPEGHVTAVPGISRTAMLRCLGNGVVPQQAAAAIRQLTGHQHTGTLPGPPPGPLSEKPRK